MNKDTTVPADQLEQWRNSAKAIMTPNFVAGDNIR
jgi:surfactin synthase thioesterase subunit